MSITSMTEWLQKHPNWHSRLDITDEKVILTFGPKSPELPYPAWVWWCPMLWPLLVFLGSKR